MDPLDRYDSHLYGSISLFKWSVAGYKNALDELLVNRFIIRRVNDYGWEKYFLTALGLRELCVILRSASIYLMFRKAPPLMAGI